MKPEKFSSWLLVLIIFLTVFPGLVNGAGLVPPCGGQGENPCTFQDIKTLIQNVLGFLIFNVAVPLSAVAITIGGAMMVMFPTQEAKRTLGKEILWTAVWGLVIVLGAWALVVTILEFLTYRYELPPEPTPPAG